VGFDVYAHLDLGDGRSTDTRRATDLVRSSEQAAFERLMVLLAAQAARRRLGDAGETMPLHVAISAPLLEHAADLAVVLDLFRQYPALAQSLVLSVPAELFETETTGLERLSSAGIRLAAEGEASPVATLKKFGAAFVKLPATALLEAGETGKAARRMEELLDMSAGIQLIVTDVAQDEQAVRLIDLGIDLMAGARFSGPRLLRPSGTGNASRLATLLEPPPASSAG
jgi:cyclic-di-GMP phosphodiesterase, flagellum assembly factor TipF